MLTSTAATTKSEICFETMISHVMQKHREGSETAGSLVTDGLTRINLLECLVGQTGSMTHKHVLVQSPAKKN